MEVEVKEVLDNPEFLKQSLADTCIFMKKINKLPLRVEGLAKFSKSVPVRRSKLEVVDSNPYRRLMALQRMGIVENYESIREFSVAIVADMCIYITCLPVKVTKLLMQLEGLGRPIAGGKARQAGMTKTDAAGQTLSDINPDDVLESYTMNITTVKGFEIFMSSLRNKSFRPRKEGSGVDLVLSCVDNYVARMAVNQACNEIHQTWMESGVSEDAVSGHIQLLIPGETACFACAHPSVIASGSTNEH